jgi:hypothetical protein
MHDGGVGIQIKEQWINFIPQGQIFQDTFNIYNKFWDFLKYRKTWTFKRVCGNFDPMNLMLHKIDGQYVNHGKTIFGHCLGMLHYIYTNVLKVL